MTVRFGSKNLLKMSILPIVSGIIFCVWFASATSTGNLSLSEQLMSYKNTLETKADSTMKKLHSEYERIVAPEKATPNYQSLVCLGVIEDDALLYELDAELELLKKDLLQEYVALNAKIFNLLNEYSVGLIDSVVYETQYQKLMLEVTSYYENNSALLDAADTEYLEEIFNFISENKAYSDNNDDLLKSLNAKIIKIQNTINNFSTLEEGIFEINNALNINQGNFFDTLNKTRDTIVATLDLQLENYMSKYERRYKNNPELKNLYESKKYETVKMFGTALDQQIDAIAGARYDREDYAYAKEQVGVIKGTFYEGEMLRCNKVLSTTIDLWGYIDDVDETVKELRDDVNNGVIALSSSGADQTAKEDLYSSFKEFYTVHYNNELAAFKEFLAAKTATTTTSVETKTVDTTSNTDTTTTIALTVVPYTFDRPFEKWEKWDGVKYLQLLLKDLWIYNYDINSIFDANTAESVYQFQLKKGILKGVAGETAQGYLGPATRAALNVEMQKYAAKTEASTVETTEESSNEFETSTKKVASGNICLDLLYELEARYGSKASFIVVMNKGLIHLDETLDQENLTVQKRMVLENIREAIQLYLNDIQ